MAVGMADREKERVRDAVAAGAALDVLQKSTGSHNVAEVQNVHRGRHPVRKMVQARALAVGDSKIVHIALAMKPGGGDASVRTVFLGVFGQPGAEPGGRTHGAV